MGCKNDKCNKKVLLRTVNNITTTGTAKNSIELDSGDLQLVNDALTPGNDKYYGTDATGTKGYHDLPTPPPGGSDELVKASATDPTPGFLDSKVKNSIEVDSEDLQLVGDAPSPEIFSYYGTNGAGVKGFYRDSPGYNLYETSAITQADSNFTSGVLDNRTGTLGAPTGFGNYEADWQIARNGQIITMAFHTRVDLNISQPTQDSSIRFKTLGAYIPSADYFDFVTAGTGALGINAGVNQIFAASVHAVIDSQIHWDTSAVFNRVNGKFTAHFKDFPDTASELEIWLSASFYQGPLTF
jgi:hypothetical protein